MSKVRLFIDGRMLEGGGTGVATYAHTLIAAAGRGGRYAGLVRASRSTGPVRRFFRAALRQAVPLHGSEGDLVGSDIFRLAQRRFDLTGAMLTLRAPGPRAIMHWTYPVPVAIEGWANVYTVHDAIPIQRPDLSPINPARQARLLRAVEARAARIVTVTQAARMDLVRELAWAPDRVTDCGQAVDTPPAHASLPPDLASRGFFLFCGRLEARKNLSRLIAAHRLSGTHLPLVIAGPVVEDSAPILAAISAADRVRYLGYADRATLLALIAHARALMLPSLLEGFGLPVAEAMAAGTPTLISRDPALLEVSGGAGLAVGAEDVAGMAAAITQLAQDEQLCAALAVAGRARAAAFTVDRWAERLEQVYGEVEQALR